MRKERAQPTGSADEVERRPRGTQSSMLKVGEVGGFVNKKGN